MKSFSKKLYYFTMSADVVLGRPTPTQQGLRFEGRTDRRIFTQKIITNVSCPNLFFITDLIVSGESMFCGRGEFDLNTFDTQKLDIRIPVLPLASEIKVFGRYTGYIPVGWFTDARYTASITFIGPEVLE